MVRIEDFKTSSNSWSDAIEESCFYAANSTYGRVQPLRKIYELDRTVNLKRSGSYNNICNIDGIAGGIPNWRKPNVHGTVFKTLGDFPAFQIAAYDNLQYLNQVKFSNFSIQGHTSRDSYTQPSWESIGIKFGDGGSVRQIILDNIEIADFHIGLFGFVSELFMSNSRISVCKYGTWFQSIVDSVITTTHLGSGPWNNWIDGGSAFHANFANNLFLQNFVRFQVQKGGYGATFKNIQSSTISGCIFDQNTKYGLAVNKGQDLSVFGNKFIANGQGGFYARNVNNLMKFGNTYKENVNGVSTPLDGLTQHVKENIDPTNTMSFSNVL